ncbi:unnamed protein product [Diamesa tonsa]
MKRIIKKPKIVLRTSRFGRTQMLNATKTIPVIESIPVPVDVIEIQNTPEENIPKVEIMSEFSEHTDILPQEQGPELVLKSEIEEIPVLTIDDQVDDIQPMIIVPQQNTIDEEFRGFEFDEKDTAADEQIKHLEKSEVTQEFNESQIQIKVLHSFELKKDDIQKLDETLKVVSLNLNSCSVSEDLELENTKLKLVIKHLMNKLQVSSLQETFEFDEEIVDLTENVDIKPLVTEEPIDATMQEDAHENMNHLTNYNVDVELIQPMDVITVNDDNCRKRKLSSSADDVNETMTKISKTEPLLEESSITLLEESSVTLLEESSIVPNKTNFLEITSPNNSLFSSPVSSRRNSAESLISDAPTYISIEEQIKANESTIVETVANTVPTLVDSIVEPPPKEKKSTNRSSKVEKQTLKRSSKEHKSSRNKSIEPVPKLKNEKKSLVQTKLCFNKQIESKKGNIATSTPQKNLRSSRSESASSSNKNEMIRFDYVKTDTESKKNTSSKVVKPATDFCKAMEELNVIKKTKKPKLVVNDVKPTSTTREQHPRSSNRSKCEESIKEVSAPTCEVVSEPLPLPLPAEQKPTTSKVSKPEKKSKEVVRKKSIEKIVNNKSEITTEIPEKLTPKPKRGKKLLASSQTLVPPIIPTEVLEKAVESLVPYDEILTVLRFASHVTTGRPTFQEKATIERKRIETKKLLEKLKYFHCGNCQKDVTKQKWMEHWINHGGIAWIDGFEKAINLNDWEDSLRRFVNNMKTYKVPSLICSICSEERKSALGHLSHIIICGFDDETVERRKKECTTCDARMLPFNYPYHKKVCSGLIELQSKLVEEVEVEDPPTNELDSSGRVKRKAVQKAEKKFKSMLKVFANPLDNLKEKNGIFKCRLCVQSFSDQEVAIKHIKTEHDTAKDLYETEDTGSDASVHDVSSSDDSDGSSGDEESEIQTNSEEDSDALVKSTNNNNNNNNNNNSRKRAPRPLQTTLSHDSQESMHVRMCISKIVGDWRKMQRISTATLKWTTESHRKSWINEVFPDLIAAATVDPILDATSVLQSLNFNTNSMKFKNEICTSVWQFEHKFNIKDDDWEQLQFADVKYDKQGITMFCGGQVSSLDWSPSNSEFNFLAVACNNDESRESNQMVTQTQKSIIQIFQFNNLNINSDKDKNCCNLMYAFIVDDGPVWSVKFCPTGAPSPQRIGLIAVSTAIGDVLIYSLPNVLKASPSLLHLEASVVCKLKDDMIFNDIFNQACQLTWFHNSKTNLLTAGFLDGTVAIWDMNNMKSLKKEVTSNVIYPSSVAPAHIERITALDIRSTDDAIYLITTGLDRKVRTFCMTDTNVLYEVSNYQCKSRLFCAKWWHNWPSMLLGEDDCFTPNSLFMRNPYEFAYRYHSFYAFPGCVIDMTINHYQNTAMFVTDSGDVVGYEAQQLLTCTDAKYKEKELKFHSFADFSKITSGAADEIGVIFCDLKDPCPIASRKRRIDDLPYINNLQINQICFNRNEDSNKFYALGYANGFVRVRFIPNPK